MTIAVVVNPNARGGRRDPGLAGRLRAQLGARGELVVTRSPEELDAAVARFRDREVPLVATCGGDGTNLTTLTALWRAYPPGELPTLALLRGGTLNTVAHNLGIGGRPETLLGRLLGRAQGRAPIPVVEHDLVQVNDRVGFLFAAAMGARFLEAYYDAPAQTPLWAGALAARTVASSLLGGALARRLFAPTEMDLEVDGARLAPSRYRLLLASTVPDVGLGMRVTWQAGREPGRFHLVASGLSTRSMALQLPRVLRGAPLAGHPHLDRLAAHARVRFAREEPFTLDGELYRAQELELRAGPRVRIALP